MRAGAESVQSGTVLCKRVTLARDVGLQDLNLPTATDSSSHSRKASRIRSRILFCAVVSTISRKSATERRSPLTAYCRAGNVTFRPLPPRRSQIADLDGNHGGTSSGSEV